MNNFQALRMAAEESDAAKIIEILSLAEGELQIQFLTALSGAWRIIHDDPDEDRWIDQKKLFSSPESWVELLHGNSIAFQEPEAIIKAILAHQAIEIPHGYSTDEIIKALTFLPALQEIVVSWNSEQMSELFQQIKNAVFMQITDAPVRSIGPEIALASRLQTVYLYNNQIEEVAQEIGRLEGLEELDLFQNRIEKIPASLGNCRQLRQLDISSNSIKALPASLFSIQNLRVLHVGNNPLIHGVPKEVAGLVSLETLGIEGTNTIDLRPLASLIHLRTLYFDNNAIRFFPSAILPVLQKLYISSDQLSATLDWVKGSDSIAELGVRGGKRPVDVELVASLPRLTALTISDVAIEGLEKIGKLPQLETLTLSNNDLRSVPEELKLLTRLKDLKITHNPIRSLPEVFGGFEHVVSIDLTNNQLESLPDSLLLNSRIRLLWAQGNPFSQERLEDMRRKGRRI